MFLVGSVGPGPPCVHFCVSGTLGKNFWYLSWGKYTACHGHLACFCMSALREPECCMAESAHCACNQTAMWQKVRMRVCMDASGRARLSAPGRLKVQPQSSVSAPAARAQDASLSLAFEDPSTVIPLRAYMDRPANGQHVQDCAMPRPQEPSLSLAMRSPGICKCRI